MKTDMSKECLCAQSKKMILYTKEEMCKLLNIDGDKEIEDFLTSVIKPRPGLEKPTLENLVDSYLNSYVKPKKYCGVLPSTVTNQGYYIKPRFDLNHMNNVLSFSPLYSIKNSSTSEYTQLKGDPVALRSHAISSGVYGPENCKGDILAYLMNSSGFYHHDFQYSIQFPNFSEAFISYYDLFMIVNYADYIGIVGSKISTGKFLIDDSDSIDISNHECNKEYFTYRIIGFNRFDCDNQKQLEDQGQIVLNRANNTNPEIPAETWAIPCPPRWKPQ